MSGMAPMDQLRELWSLLVDNLRRCLTVTPGKKAPSAELLAVARKVLKDAGVVCPDEESRKRLERLYAAYLQRLSEAMEQERPSAAHLAEARAFLAWIGHADIPAASAGKAAQQLLEASVPFRITNTKH